MKQFLNKSLLFALFVAVHTGLLILFPVTSMATPGRQLHTTRIKAIATVLTEAPISLGRPIHDRPAWEKLAGKKSFRRVIAQAEKLLEEPIPDLPDDLYLDYSRTGNRTRCQAVLGKRRNRINGFVLAECLENHGRFLPAFEEIVREICMERTWVYPAHDWGGHNFRRETINIDLASSRLGWELATADCLLGDKISRQTRQLIHDNVRRRILEPFRNMATGKREADWWVSRMTNNWNAVCLAGVTGAALAILESPQDQAFFIAAAEKCSENFLKGFPSDGYCTEGVGYWNYGFGHYLILAELIHQATTGKVDLLDRPIMRPVATYGARIEIVNGICPSFADCNLLVRPGANVMYFVSRRFGFGWRRWENADMITPHGWLCRTLMYAFPNSASRTPPVSTPYEGPGLRSWFDQGGVLIGRPAEASSCRLGVALKGGHNDEHHNHNDVGSFVAVVGKRMLLCDPGPEVYTDRTFSSRRYESNLLNSFGHSVPVVAGQLQKAGRDAQGVVIRTDFTDDADTLVLDMRSAYDVPELKTLERTFVYSRRGAGSLTVTDDVVFDKPKSFATALITFGQFKNIGHQSLVIENAGESVRVDIESAGSDFEIRTETIQEDAKSKMLPTRLGIDLTQPVTKATVTVKIAPMPPSDRRQ